MTEKQIYLEGEEAIIKEVLEIARKHLGKGINVVNLMPCIEKWKTIDDLKEILEGCSPEDDLEDYIKKLEDRE